MPLPSPAMKRRAILLALLLAAAATLAGRVWWTQRTEAAAETDAPVDLARGRHEQERQLAERMRVASAQWLHADELSWMDSQVGDTLVRLWLSIRCEEHTSEP